MTDTRTSAGQPLLLRLTTYWKKSGHTPAISILFLAAAACVGVHVAFSVLESNSVRQNQAQTTYQSAAGVVYQLNAQEETAHADRFVGDDFPGQEAALNESLQADLIHLAKLGQPAQVLGLIRRSADDYRAQTDIEFDLIRAGRYAAAERQADANVDPDWTILLAQVETAQMSENAVAAHSARLVYAGLDCALILAACMICVVVLRSFSVLRRAAAIDMASRSLVRSERRLNALIHNSSDVVLVISASGIVRYASPAVERMWGIDGDGLIDRNLSELVHPDDLNEFRNGIGGAQRGSDASALAECRIRHADSTWRTCEILVGNRLDDPEVEGLVLTCRDIMERKEFESELQKRAFSDALTELPNRALFADTLRRTLARSDLLSKPIAVIFLDLDNFKIINDSLGHEAGDELLKCVAERLSTTVRPTDMVARLGGDEFTILVDGMAHKGDAEIVADRISKALRAPCIVGSREVFTTASIGIVVSAGEHITPEELLRDADTAMYQAKTNGKGVHVVFDYSMNTRAIERLELETELRRALDQSEMVVHYQPIISLDSEHVTEVEALVRWRHPVRGLVPPLKFIPLAEETGLIVPLGEWVLRTACFQVQEWQNEFALDPPLTVSVNVSARQLQDPAIIRQISHALRDSGLPAQRLKLEITESVMIGNPEVTIPMLQEMHALGVRLAVDDFGTGYSSISYLSNLPIDTLKIDRSFVAKMGQNHDDDALLNAIVTMAKMMNLNTTSEGIETVEQFDGLRELGCDLGQGFLFAKPLPGAELAQLLSKNSSGPQQTCTLNARPQEAPIMEAA